MANEKDFNTTVDVIGDSYAIAQIEALPVDYKQILSKRHAGILRKHFVMPIRKSDLLPKSSKTRYKSGRPRNLDAIYPRGRYWPRVYYTHPAKLGRIGNVSSRVQYHKKSAKYHKNFIFHRKHLRASVRVAPVQKGKIRPWNMVRVLWGNKLGGSYQAGYLIKKHGDYRPKAIQKYHPRITREIGRLIEEVLREHRIQQVRTGLSFALKVTQSPYKKTKIAKMATKKRSRTKAIDRRLKRYEEK